MVYPYSNDDVCHAGGRCYIDIIYPDQTQTRVEGDAPDHVVRMANALYEACLAKQEEMV